MTCDLILITVRKSEIQDSYEILTLRFLLNTHVGWLATNVLLHMMKLHRCRICDHWPCECMPRLKVFTNKVCHGFETVRVKLEFS